ncbi:DUF421 domain-containing protein [Paenibacillus sp. ACRRX]|uniref:DUF421 domain-containing protein n=1 Tax=Paenibacillus sp. ACRRX TaxID=2918206 RepID=UPI001EF59CE1|nr:DUF421 domain-containing protein [Paenibacillus sp. ACRRX]MCG7410345.1 DUF421 domain-containing protein [Paenibacillus sp. ACRRX]
MNVWPHIWHTILMYFLVFIVLRVMGKREIGKLSVFDLVISIMIAEIAVFSIENTERPLLESITPMIVLVVVQVTLAFLTLKSRRLREIFDGKPSIIISQGNLNREEMRKQRYNLDDLMLQLREQGVDSVQDVEYAILEATGKLTIFMKDEAIQSGGQSGGFTEELESGSQQVGSRPGDLVNIPSRAGAEGSPSKADQTKSRGSVSSSGGSATGESAVYAAGSIGSAGSKPVIQADKIKFVTLPLPLIMDGKVMDDSLEQIDKTRFWLKAEMKLRGIKDFKDVFFCSIDHKGELFLDKKDAIR